MKSTKIIRFILKTISFIVLNLVLINNSIAQNAIKGSIFDAENNLPLADANIQVVDYLNVTKSNAKGEFNFKNLNKPNGTIRISHIGFETQLIEFTTSQNKLPTIFLAKKIYLADEVIVNATRTNAKSGMAFENVTKQAIGKSNMGQDIPQLLNFTPSIVTTSDAGAGIGYTGMRIRGSDATRVNVTINGIPLNDSESQGSYLINLPDFASSVSSIQIQRGVGASTNGAGAFGGTVNIQTSDFKEKKYLEIASSTGSFGTFKNTVMAGTGLLNKHFTIDGRLSKIDSKGFVDRAFSNLWSYYLSGAFIGKKSFARLNVFAGNEKTYQAWNGIPEAKLNGNLAEINNYIDRNYLSEIDASNLVKAGNRTYNQFLYNNQVDNYTQKHLQLLSSNTLSSNLTLNINGHYTRGYGYYEEYKDGQNLNKYFNNEQEIKSISTDLTRRKWLKNDFYGVTFSLDYIGKKGNLAIIGGGLNQYKGTHFGEIIWTKEPVQLPNYGKWYVNNALKTDFNIYTKGNFQLNEKLSAYGDMQLRTVGYDMIGLFDKLRNLLFDNNYTFFNPKLGLNLSINDNANAYFSYSVGNKEPSRNDFIDNAIAPKSENLNDFELGYKLNNSNFRFGFNAYYMLYYNQLVLNGNVNNVGDAIRTNVPKSHRAGVEFEVTSKLSSKITWATNLTLSQNKIDNFIEKIPSTDAEYNPLPDKDFFLKSTNIAYSPNVIAGSQLIYQSSNNFEIGFLSKFVGKQYLDNTSNENRRINKYLTNDLRAIYKKPFNSLKELKFTLLVNNIFNKKYESNGYTYSYIVDKNITTENFYYPQAGTNFLFGINLGF